MEVSKIQFSKEEQEMMLDADLILTKNRVLEKWKLLLENIQDGEVDFVMHSDLHKEEIFQVPPKISKGENYLGLPWLILDYPRTSAGNHLFFIRQMFWWGRMTSITLHLSGKYKAENLQRIRNAFPKLQSYSIGIHESPWVHHFENDNYRPVASLSEKAFDEACLQGDHLKLAISWPLAEWQEASRKLEENWRFLLNLCGLVTNAV